MPRLTPPPGSPPTPGASTPSVLRFAQALGFGSYPGLQEALRRELTQQANAPINRRASRPSPAGPASLLAAGAESTARSALDSLAALPPSQVQALVGLLVHRH